MVVMFNSSYNKAFQKFSVNIFMDSAIGAPYKDKLLPLPKFLLSDNDKINSEEKRQALSLTSYFFNRYLFHNHRQPEIRQAFVEYILEKDAITA